MIRAKRLGRPENAKGRNLIMEALIELGLNPITGKSRGAISVEALEEKTNLRINGNGSVMRRDSKPWMFFNYEPIYEKNKIVAYKFKGYMTPKTRLQQIEDQVDGIETRIEGEKQKKEELEEEYQMLQEMMEDGYMDANVPLYDVDDLSPLALK